MTEFLQGALTVARLGREAAAGSFRAEDERGAVAWLVRGQPFTYLHAVEFRAAGVRRGFHAHADHREHLYLASGSLRVLASAGGAPVELTLEAGMLATFAPGTAHGFIALEPSLAVCFGDGADPFAGTAPHPELQPEPP